MNRSEIIKDILESKIVAVVRTKFPDKLLRIAESIYEGGIRYIEITMTVQNALEMIKSVKAKVSKDIVIGVGSVLSTDTAQRAIDAGAEFVVSPIFRQDIIETAHKNEKPAMPGCMTPTEIYTAYNCGADIIKVFPADVVGMSFFKSIKAPIPDVLIMPTGGVTLDNGGDWIKAGACAVGVGSALLDEKAIEENNYRKLTENALRISASVRNAGQNESLT